MQKIVNEWTNLSRLGGYCRTLCFFRIFFEGIHQKDSYQRGFGGIQDRFDLISPAVRIANISRV
jgi:hypothetical protein